MHQCERAIPPCSSTQGRQGDRVVASDADREDVSVHQRRNRGLDAGHRLAHVAGHHARIAGVGDVQPFEHVDVAPVRVHRTQHHRHRTDRVRTESCARAVRGAGVAGQADDRRIEGIVTTCLGQTHEGRQPAEARAIERIDGEEPAHRSNPPGWSHANRVLISSTRGTSAISLRRSGARAERTPERRAQNMVRIGCSGVGL